MNPVDRFNSIEIVLWTCFALATATFGHRTSLAGKPGRIVLTLTFLAFAWSDFVELKSGAWWRPWWLPVVKGSCLVIFTNLARSSWRKWTYDQMENHKRSSDMAGSKIEPERHDEKTKTPQ